MDILGTSMVPTVDLCDASTVINYSLEKNKTPNKNEKKKTNNKAVNNWPSSKKEKGASEQSDDYLLRINKVVNWLNYDSIFPGSLELTENKECERDTLHWWLERDSSTPLPTTRLRCFLMDIQPDIDSKPLDCVSGHCKSGCKNLYPFSVMNHEDLMPVCPFCSKSDQNKELELVFALKLHVMDGQGNRYNNINLCKEDAECFLQCTVMDFVTNERIRQDRVQFLRNHFLQNTLNNQYTPMLDLSLVKFKKLFFIVNSALAIKIANVIDM